MNSFESKSLAMELAGEQLLLHPHRALYRPASRTLLVADVHVGKEHCFGRTGIAIPGGISEQVLERLFALCRESAATTLCVLGDFMHSLPMAEESWLGCLSRLLDTHPALSVHVIAGNHDSLQGRSIIDDRITWHDEPLSHGPFLLQHEPGDDPRGYVLSGHLHPAMRLGRGRRGSLRAPVFWFRRQHGVLPAFGEFTGGMTIKPDRHHDQVYLSGDDCVMKLPLDTLKKRYAT